MKLLLLMGLVTFGVVGHLFHKLAALEAAGTVLSPFTYIRQRPYRSLSAVMGTFLLAYGLYAAGQLTEFAAISLGVLASEAWDALRARAAGQLRSLLPGTEDTGSSSQ